MVVSGCRSLVAERWRLKPEALGSIPGGTTFFSFPLLFQRSSDSNDPDNLYRSSDLGEPHLSGSLCCDEAQILSKSETHTAIITYQHIQVYPEKYEVCHFPLFTHIRCGRFISRRAHTHTHTDKVAEAAVAGEGTLGGSCGGVQAPHQI